MKCIRVTVFSAAVLCLLTSNAAYSATYQATILHPLTGYADSAGNAAAVSHQVGNGSVEVSPGVFQFHALLWNGTADSVFDLNPAGFDYSFGEGASQNTQVGAGTTQDFGASHALLWRGTAESAIDLHPVGFVDSYATGATDEVQVGYGSIGVIPHALRWSGTAASVVDLHPAGFDTSSATDTSGVVEVGFGTGVATGGEPHALLWRGSAASVVDLHPDGFEQSYTEGVSGDSQVGWGAKSGGTVSHALLWNGTAASVIDLNPSGYDYTAAYDVYGNTQVGYGIFFDPQGSGTHAMLWNGSASSAVDLHQFLAELPIHMYQSLALGIADDGTIVGAARDADQLYAVLWTPVVPEPSTWQLLFCGTFAALIRACGRSRLTSQPRPRR